MFIICSSTVCSISANVACGCAALHCATAAKLSSPCAFQRACKSSGCILDFSLLDSGDNSFPLRQCTISWLIPPTHPQQASGAKICIAPHQKSLMIRADRSPFTSQPAHLSRHLPHRGKQFLFSRRKRRTERDFKPPGERLKCQRGDPFSTPHRTTTIGMASLFIFC